MEHQLQEFMQRMQVLQQQLELLQHQLGELEQVKDTVSTVESTEGGQETLIPLGAGVYAKGTITDSKKVFMNVGAQVVVEKDTAHANKKVEEQMEQLQNIGQEMKKELNQLTQMIQTIQMNQGH